MQFGQLFYALVIHKLVFYITQQVCYFGYTLSFLYHGTGYQETFLCQPDDEMFFRQ